MMQILTLWQRIRQLIMTKPTPPNTEKPAVAPTPEQTREGQVVETLVRILREIIEEEQKPAAPPKPLETRRD
jgi:hypothetical protein